MKYTIILEHRWTLLLFLTDDLHVHITRCYIIPEVYFRCEIHEVAHTHLVCLYKCELLIDILLFVCFILNFRDAVRFSLLYLYPSGMPIRLPLDMDGHCVIQEVN